MNLCGYIGSPALEIIDDLQEFQTSPDEPDVVKMKLYDMSNDIATIRNLAMKNVGTVPIFLYFQIFTDLDEKMNCNWQSGLIQLDENTKILSPNETHKVSFNIIIFDCPPFF